MDAPLDRREKISIRLIAFALSAVVTGTFLGACSPKADAPSIAAAADPARLGVETQVVLVCPQPSGKVKVVTEAIELGGVIIPIVANPESKTLLAVGGTLAAAAVGEEFFIDLHDQMIGTQHCTATTTVAAIGKNTGADQQENGTTSRRGESPATKTMPRRMQERVELVELEGVNRPAAQQSVSPLLEGDNAPFSSKGLLSTGTQMALQPLTQVSPPALDPRTILSRDTTAK